METESRNLQVHVSFKRKRRNLTAETFIFFINYSLSVLEKVPEHKRHDEIFRTQVFFTHVFPSKLLLDKSTDGSNWRRKEINTNTK